MPNFAKKTIDWQLELDQGITEFIRGSQLCHRTNRLAIRIRNFYVDANFTIGPIDWQLQLDQGVTEFYVAATFAIGPIEWQLEIRPGHH